MKKSTLLFIASGLALFVFQSFELGKRRDGTEPGHTGSPGDSLKTCTVCHGGTVEWQPGWITSNIPAEGWVPGNIYTITATNTNGGYDRFGFQVSPQDKKGNLLGEIIISDSVTTKLVGNNKYITYTAFGVDGADSKSWTFKWKAPADTVNEVTFYGAFNANHGGHKFSDKTTITNLRVFRQGFTGVEEKSNFLTKEFKIGYVPEEKVILIFPINRTVKLSEINLYSISGNLVYSSKPEDGAPLSSFKLNGSSFASGIYLLEIKSSKGSMVEKILLK